MDRMQAPVIGRLMTGAFLKFLPDNLDISRFLATPLRSATWQSCKNSFGPDLIPGLHVTGFHRVGPTGGIEQSPLDLGVSPGIFRSQTPRPGFLQSGVQELVIREARPEEYWEVADMHCAAFYPNSSFPMDFILRSDRISALLENLGMKNGIKKKCLIALDLGLQPPHPHPPPLLEFDGETHFLGGPFLRPLIASFSVGLPFVSWTFSGLNTGPKGIVGSVTVDTNAEFLKRRRPGTKRRKGIGYVSNMAVRGVQRRRGIGNVLLRRAESLVAEWGCASVALHCDKRNDGALSMYLKEGYRIVREPEGAKWPKPWGGEEVQLVLMMKRVTHKDRDMGR